MKGFKVIYSNIMKSFSLPAYNLHQKTFITAAILQ